MNGGKVKIFRQCLCYTYLLVGGEMESSRGHLVELRRCPMRSRVEIMADILDETRSHPQGLRKTRLMYRCNLSFRQLKIYVKLLCDKGFLEMTVLNPEGLNAKGKNGKVEIYRITEGGLSFLKTYNDLRRHLREGSLRR
jgi:predicted transcriptional regulator